MPTWKPNVSKYSFEFKKRIVQLHCRNKTHKEISKIVSKSEPVILAVINNYDKRRSLNFKCSEYTEMLAIKLYTKTKIGGIKISRYLNINVSMFYDILKRNDIPVREPNEYRKYTLDEEYFKNINTEHKAYWLGLLIADGCNSRGRVTRLSLNKKDIHILESMKKDLSSNQEIVFGKHNMAILNINSRKLTKSLEKFGFVENKTYKTFLPNIPYDLYRHFIRGYFDGDGCITYSVCKSYNKKKTKVRNNYVANFTLAGTETILHEVQKIFISEIGLNKTKMIKTRGVSVLAYGGHNNINAIYNFLYENSTIYLKRKKNKFEDYFAKRL